MEEESRGCFKSDSLFCIPFPPSDFVLNACSSSVPPPVKKELPPCHATDGLEQDITSEL